MGLRISLLCNDGSPLGVSLKTLYGDDVGRVGVGGSEYAMLTMCEAWHNRGDEVILYNDPKELDGSPFEQRPIGAFNPNEPRDVLISFRSPNAQAIHANNCLKVFWSCDQYTIGNFAPFAALNNKTVCISPFHVRYHQANYGIQNIECIDIPVRMDDFNVAHTKLPGRLIFTSVPDRGLDQMLKVWLKIKNIVSEATLVITSDYRLWGCPATNEQHRRNWLQAGSGVNYKGALRRSEYVQELLQADLYIYPNTYDELFCVACSEAQVAGAYPITSSVGALETTNMGMIVPGNPLQNPLVNDKIAELAIELLQDHTALKVRRKKNMALARERFSVNTILKQWDEKVFKNG